ncbi:MAG: acetylornithine/succinylornithine family transaminase [Planctomycetota bacterium]
MDFAALEQAYEFDVYPKRDVTIVRGKNALVWDDQGNEYIDCIVGHGVANLGHAHPVIVDAIQRQAEKLTCLSNVFYNDQRALLLEQLVKISPEGLTRAFLCNSGTESIEAAIKFARFTTGRTDFVCAMRSFHGRSCGALSATFKADYRKPFEPLLPGFHFAPYNNFEKFEAQVTDQTAAILLEPIQGEGGVNFGDAEFFRQIRQLCDQRDILLIIDEVQSGFCRTGMMFGCDHFDVSPDIMCVAKAIAGGLPMGAVVCSDKVTIPKGKHGTTCGGNPLCSAAARAAIATMLEDDLCRQAQEKGDYLAKRLAAHTLTKVRTVRHRGLMFGIELKQKVVPTIRALLERGLLVFPAGATVIRVYPPLTIEYEVLDRVADRLVEALA